MITHHRNQGKLRLPDLIKGGREFLDWASDHGAGVGNNNWLERSIVRMEKIWASPDDVAARELFEQIYDDPVVSQNNLSDLIHLRFIRQNIGDQNPHLLAKKLSEVLKGVDSVREERSSNTKPRDVRFELSICARHNSLGVPTLLSDPNPDLVSTWRNQVIAVEAKRVFSGERMEDRIAEAHRQLRDRECGASADIRIIYCDITRSFTEGRLHIQVQGDREVIFRNLHQMLKKAGLDVLDKLNSRGAIEVDAVILWYQDYFEPKDEEYTVVGITQALGVVNPLPLRKRRRNTERFLRKLSLEGVDYC